MSGLRLRLVAACAAAILGPLVLSPPAWAGGELVGGEPLSGAALPSAPDAVVLAFSAVPDPELSHISVRDASGDEVTSGSAVRDGGRTLRQPIAVRGPGDYSVAYHIEFSDGSELIGARFFSVGTGVPPSAGAAERAAAAAAVATHEHGVDPLSAVLLLVDLTVTVVVAALLVLRRPRTGPPRAWRLRETDGPGPPAA